VTKLAQLAIALPLKQPGFLANLPLQREILVTNPVAGYPFVIPLIVESRNRVFGRIAGCNNNFGEKPRFWLTVRHSRETGFLAEFLDCNEIFW
jgi:hypothetical protein